jgi:hypothetical protein
MKIHSGLSDQELVHRRPFRAARRDSLPYFRPFVVKRQEIARTRGGTGSSSLSDLVCYRLSLARSPSIICVWGNARSE